MNERSRITIDTYHNSALRYQEKFMKMDLYNDLYDNFIQLLPHKNAEIFEIGCGPGNVCHYFLSQNPHFRILGVDMAPAMLQLAKQNNPQAEFLMMDAREIGKLKKEFDAILCPFCLPYLSKEESSALIRDAWNLLKPGGLIYLSTMEDDYDKSGFEVTSFSAGEQVYIYYHQEDFLSKSLQESGFRIITVQRRKYPEPDGSHLTDLILFAQKEQSFYFP